MKKALRNNSFMQYKIPSRLDIGDIRVESGEAMSLPVLLGQNL